jgi:hypothetical protein
VIDATGSKIDFNPVEARIFHPISSYDAHPARLLLRMKTSGLAACPATRAVVNQWLPGMTFTGRFSSDIFVTGDLFVPLAPYTANPFNPVNMKRQKTMNGSGRIVVTDGRLEGPPVREDTQELIPRMAGKGYDFDAVYITFDMRRGACDNWLDYRGTPDVTLYGHTSADLKVNYVLALSLMRGLGPATPGSNVPFTDALVPIAYYEGQIRPDPGGGFRLDYTRDEYVPMTALTTGILDRAFGRKVGRAVYHFDPLSLVGDLFAGTRRAWNWLSGTSDEMDEFIRHMKYHRPPASGGTGP